MTGIAEALRLYGLAGVHPAADLFPMLDASELDQLAADAKEQGWNNPVVVTPDGHLLDGRNRLIASVMIGLDVPIRRLDPPDPIAWVLSENLRRRHLNTAQRAVLALAVEKLYAEQAKERQRVHGGTAPGRPASLGTEPSQVNDADAQARKSAQRAADQVGVGPTAVKLAKKLAAEAPDLLDQAKSGKTSLDAAAKEAARRPKPPEPRPAAPKRPEQPTILLPTHTGDLIPYPQPRGKSTFNPTNEHISWAAWSWNPVTGCLHGCDYCYARDLATKASYAATYPAGFTPLFHHERLDAPSNTRIPADVEGDPRRGRVFVCSMADLFGNWVPQDWIDKVYESMAAAPKWRYLTLTKFPQRYRRHGVPPRMWAGTSVDTQARVRIAEQSMAELPAAVRWLSIEPLEEPLHFTDLSWCDWMVIGSRTATRQPTGPVPEFAPPFAWVVDLVAQARAAGAAVYLKPNLLGQTGPQSPGMDLPREMPAERQVSA